MFENGKEVLLTWGEIAAFLSVSEKTVIDWNVNYGLPVRRVGNRILATKRSILLWIELDFIKQNPEGYLNVCNLLSKQPLNNP